MNPLLDLPISAIYEALLLMSALAERACTNALKALNHRDDAFAKRVEEDEVQIDEMEIRIDEMVMTYMATRGPVATDCRFSMVASRISSDIERVGDEAANIARRVVALNKQAEFQPPGQITKMSEDAWKMFRDSMTAFANKDPELALDVIERDQGVDIMFAEATERLTAQMENDTASVNPGLHLLGIVKSVERIADHAVHIAEDVYFLHRARDIRHGRNRPGEEPENRNPTTAAPPQ